MMSAYKWLSVFCNKLMYRHFRQYMTANRTWPRSKSGIDIIKSIFGQQTVSLNINHITLASGGFIESIPVPEKCKLHFFLMRHADIALNIYNDRQ